MNRAETAEWFLTVPSEHVVTVHSSIPVRGYLDTDGKEPLPPIASCVIIRCLNELYIFLFGGVIFDNRKVGDVSTSNPVKIG